MFRRLTVRSAAAFNNAVGRSAAAISRPIARTTAIRSSVATASARAVPASASVRHISTAPISSVNINVLDGRVDKEAPEYKKNAAEMDAIVKQLKERVAKVKLGR